LIRAFLLATPASVGSAIKYLVLGIPFLDAIYVSAVQGWLFAMPVAACSLAALFFSKRLAMT
jgi:hypothetical protein